jgi:hypothetical protein
MNVSEQAERETSTLYSTDHYSKQFGTIRLATWQEGLVLWVGGEIAWKSWDSGLTYVQRMTADKATEYADALADVLCWFNGFLMGKGEDAMMPPGWQKLRDLSADLKDHAAVLRGEQPKELPF